MYFVQLAKCSLFNWENVFVSSRLQQVAAPSPVLPSTGGQGHSQLSRAHSDSTVLFFFLKVTLQLRGGYFSIVEHFSSVLNIFTHLVSATATL